MFETLIFFALILIFAIKIFNFVDLKFQMRRLKINV